jgi:hypothetical protein
VSANSFRQRKEGVSEWRNQDRFSRRDEVREYQAYHNAGISQPDKFANVVIENTDHRGVVYRHATADEQKAAEDAAKASADATARKRADDGKDSRGSREAIGAGSAADADRQRQRSRRVMRDRLVRWFGDPSPWSDPTIAKALATQSLSLSLTDRLRFFHKWQRQILVTGGTERTLGAESGMSQTYHFGPYQFAEWMETEDVAISSATAGSGGSFWTSPTRRG